MEFKDYYQTLGIAHDASSDAIKKAYRRLARKYHPDVSKEKDAAARMAEDLNAPAALQAIDQWAATAPEGDGEGEALLVDGLDALLALDARSRMSAQELVRALAA